MSKKYVNSIKICSTNSAGITKLQGCKFKCRGTKYSSQHSNRPRNSLYSKKKDQDGQQACVF